MPGRPLTFGDSRSRTRQSSALRLGAGVQISIFPDGFSSSGKTPMGETEICKPDPALFSRPVSGALARQRLRSRITQELGSVPHP